jgi:hypothetical protein
MEQRRATCLTTTSLIQHCRLWTKILKQVLHEALVGLTSTTPNTTRYIINIINKLLRPPRHNLGVTYVDILLGAQLGQTPLHLHIGQAMVRAEVVTAGLAVDGDD